MKSREEMEKNYTEYLMENREDIGGQKGNYPEIAKLPYFDYVRPGHVNKEWGKYVSPENAENRRRDMMDAVLTFREMHGSEEAIARETRLRIEEEKALGISVFDKDGKVVSDEAYIHLDNYRNRPSTPKVNTNKREEAMRRLAEQEKRCSLGIFLE